MNVDDLEQLINNLLNPEEFIRNDSEKILTDLIHNPQSIFMFFQIIDKNKISQSSQVASILISRILKDYYHNLSPQLQSQIINKLINYIFTENMNQSITMHFLDIIIKYTDDNLTYMKLILDCIDSSFEKEENLYNSIYILAGYVRNFDKDDPILLENKYNFFNYSLIGLNSAEHMIIYESARLYFGLKKKNLSTENEPHLNVLIQLLQDPDIIENREFMSLLSKSISKDLIPADEAKEIISIVENIDFDQDLKFLFFIDSMNYLDQSQIVSFMNNACIYLIEQFTYEGYISNYSFESFVESLEKHQIKNLYILLKQAIDQLSNDHQDLFILVYIIIIRTCPNDFFVDIDSLISNINSALDKNDEIINILVCNVLNEFQNIFTKCNYIAIEFLPKITKFIISDNSELSLIAFKTVKSFCDCIDVSIPWLFKSLYSIKNYFFSDKIDQYIYILAKAIQIDKSANINQMKSLADFILNKSTGLIYMPILVSLMKKNEDMVQIIFPHFLNILKIQDFMKVENDYLYESFIEFLEEFGSRFNDQLQFFNQDIQKIVFSQENLKNSNLNNNLLYICGVFAKITKDKNLTTKLKKMCLKLLNSDDDYSIYDLEYVLDSCKSIIKLLDRKELKKILFNINLFLYTTKDKILATKALILMKKMLHNCHDEDRDLYLSKCIKIFEKILNGSFKWLNNKEILLHTNDVELMNDISQFITEIVRYSSPFIETVSNFVITIIKSYQNSPFLIFYIGVCCEIFLNKTVSEKAKQEIFELIPQMIQSAKYPSLKQNVSYLFHSMVKYDAKLLQNLIQYVPVLKNSYFDEKKSKFASSAMLSNLSIMFLTFFTNGMKIDESLLNEAINDFPPFDKKDTSAMLQNIISLFTSNNKFEPPTMKNAALALSRFFLLSEKDLNDRKVSFELIDQAQKLLKRFSNPEIMNELSEKFKDSEDKIAKLKAIINK